MTQIAILGYGVVGSGVVEVLNNHYDSISGRAREEINIKYIFDIRDFFGSKFEDKFTKNFEDILNDDEVKIVVEVMGGLDPAFDYVKSSMLRGKSVVTSNKELVAQKGAELLKIAQDKNVNFLFEASVGGGIPIIRPINQCLAANEVVEVAGILNGTTNFILTKMIREQMSFDDALKLAQELGYAERDPSADIDGDDSCRKVCILASLAYGKHVYPQGVHTKGIRNITLKDVKYAEAWGGVIKLIGVAKKNKEGKLEVCVEPMFVCNESQLAGVEDVFNGIMVRGDATGDVVFYGKGAGKLPTASAVVADVIDCVKHFSARKYLFWDDAEKGYVSNYHDYKMSMFICAVADDPHESIIKIKSKFGDIKRVYNPESPENEFAFVTPICAVSEIDKFLNELDINIISKIRISNL